MALRFRRSAFIRDYLARQQDEEDEIRAAWEEARNSK